MFENRKKIHRNKEARFFLRRIIILVYCWHFH